MTTRVEQGIGSATEDDVSAMSYRTVRPPSESEHHKLQRMTREAVGRVALRAHMILLSARGRSAPEIAGIYKVADVTVYKWIDRFDAEGPDGLYDREREGRPPKIDEKAEEEIERVLEHVLTEEGYEPVRWTTPLLRRHLEEELGIEVHPDTVRRALNRLQYSWKRPRRSLPKDPLYAERMADLVEAIATAGEETTVLFEDSLPRSSGETDVKRFPPLRRAWMPVGKQRAVEAPEQNGKFTLYGTLDIHTGEVHTEPYPKGRSDHTEAFLEGVLEAVPEGRVLLVWDRASWHVSKAVEEVVNSHERLEVVLLPKRAPEANPMEDLWRVLKNTVAANLERSIEALKAACQRFFDELSPERALKMAGLRAG